MLYYLHISVNAYMAYGIGLTLLFVLIGNVLFAVSVVAIIVAAYAFLVDFLSPKPL